MAGGLNKVMIVGNLGRDPEMRYMPSGKAVTNFSVAVGRTWNDANGEKKEETEWFNVVVFEKLAEVTNQYLTKGAKVYAEGRLQTRTWDGEDGQKHNRTEVVAQQVLFLDSPRRQPGSEPPAELTGDDLPF